MLRFFTFLEFEARSLFIQGVLLASQLVPVLRHLLPDVVCLMLLVPKVADSHFIGVMLLLLDDFEARFELIVPLGHVCKLSLPLPRFVQFGPQLNDLHILLIVFNSLSLRPYVKLADLDVVHICSD